ncbi:Prolyl 3,4-dihydroxylase OGFOD1 [Cucumispora dikerogammari]|nr:Prolyl 3,4-dihydroxylase OGFOD1 [Cucumispora dikerogammari]
MNNTEYLEKDLSPFPHKIIDNFLSLEEHTKALNIFNRLEFYEKQTDLFHFLQSNELNKNENLKFFLDKIEKTFNLYSFRGEEFIRYDQAQGNGINIGLDENNHIYRENNEKSPPCFYIKNQKNNEKPNKKETFLTLFASYYSKNNYLLPHDDMTETRIQAFTYYLEDCSDAKLVLFEKDGLTVHKKVDVIKNRLVIFEVSPFSFHEVETCQFGDRKAFTGWINFKNETDFESHSLLNEFSRKSNEIIAFHSKLSASKCSTNIKLFDFPIDLLNTDYQLFEDVEFPFDDFIYKKPLGPLTSRRITELEFEELNFPNFGRLLNFGVFEVKKFDYILAKDMEKAGKILDVFIFDLDESLSRQFNSIVYLNKQGEKMFEIELIKNTMHVIKREGMTWFLQRSLVDFKLIHIEYLIE